MLFRNVYIGHKNVKKCKGLITSVSEFSVHLWKEGSDVIGEGQESWQAQAVIYLLRWVLEDGCLLSLSKLCMNFILYVFCLLSCIIHSNNVLKETKYNTKKGKKKRQHSIQYNTCSRSKLLASQSRRKRL